MLRAICDDKNEHDKQVVNDIRSFKFHLVPEQTIPDLKVGMSILFKIEEAK